MKFEDYKIAKVIKTEIKNLGWSRPTDIQFKAIQPILNGEDVLAIAQTGTGKTASFVIPILNSIHNQLEKNDEHFVRALVMVPTRELAEQVEQVFVEVGKGVNVRSRSLMGGVSQDDQITDLDNGIDVVISTPGRMFDLISQGVLKVDRLQTLVLDEADHMLDLGFIKDIEDLMRHIPQKRQTLFFSATIDKKIKKIAYNLVRNAIRIQISPKDPVAKNIEHAVTFVEMDDKRFFLENIIKENDDLKIMVFVRTKVRAERVKKAMERVNIEAVTIHGDVEQKDRFKVLDQFKNNEVSVLISTDVAARGIDIPGIGAVINYDLPEEPENYVHRVGRTGRGKEKGVAISFCSEEEKILLSAIEAYNGTEIAVFDLSKKDYSAILEDSEDGTDNWRKLIEEEEKRTGKGNEW
ncbi:DEAD/DEAH box helicase [Brumimicrobium oceani]|uniref:ATP-dependent helicase n=1 Tax=Brumimicrobium oceani TaxID=2100725 RepID=A0A2U2XGW7_9FLAO|nr:DEAD/DEAH box helicase [Brumimicrobium oceani]PWH86961.1 ATP-dependent helicase [Brumimicrobium oceani]